MVRADFPSTEIVFMSIKPSTARWNKWPIMENANRIVREYSEKHAMLGYADLATVLLDDDGNLKDVFV